MAPKRPRKRVELVIAAVKKTKKVIVEEEEEEETVELPIQERGDGDGDNEEPTPIVPAKRSVKSIPVVESPKAPPPPPSPAKEAVPAAPEDAAAKKEAAPGKGDKKRRKRRARRGKGGDSYKRYVYKVLKQVHPELGVSSKAMAVLNNYVADMFERLAGEAARLSRYVGRPTMSSREIQGAVRLVLPGELGRHADAEGTKAVTNYMSYV